jgi:hypothetical protein
MFFIDCIHFFAPKISADTRKMIPLHYFFQFFVDVNFLAGPI